LVDIPHMGGAFDQRIPAQQRLEAQPLPRPPVVGAAGLAARLSPGWGRGKVAHGWWLWRLGRGALVLHTQLTRSGLDRRPRVAVVLEDAEHIERVVHVPIGQRVGAVMRIQALLTLLIDNAHPRQAGGTLRREPLAP